MGDFGRCRRRVAGAAFGALGLLIGGVLSASPARSATGYPVTWSFLTTAVVAAATNGPDVAPPGANLPCIPSAAHPDPVVLVHGLGGDQNDNWQSLSPFLADHGYCVYSLTYGNNTSAPRPFNEMGGLSTMEQSASALAQFVDSVLASTHAPEVDIVGHSEGGTMPDYYLKFLGGSSKVARFVSLSGVLHGTSFWGLAGLYDAGEAYGFGSQAAGLAALCASCEEFMTGSAFMQKLDTASAVASPGQAATCPYDGAAVVGVSYTSIATANDELVRPPTSDLIDPACDNASYGITTNDILVQDQCPADQADHLSIVSDPVAAQDVLNALDPTHQRPVPCQAVLPAIG